VSTLLFTEGRQLIKNDDQQMQFRKLRNSGLYDQMVFG